MAQRTPNYLGFRVGLQLTSKSHIITGTVLHPFNKQMSSLHSKSVLAVCERAAQRVSSLLHIDVSAGHSRNLSVWINNHCMGLFGKEGKTTAHSSEKSWAEWFQFLSSVVGQLVHTYRCASCCNGFRRKGHLARAVCLLLRTVSHHQPQSQSLANGSVTHTPSPAVPQSALPSFLLVVTVASPVVT